MLDPRRRPGSGSTRWVWLAAGLAVIVALLLWAFSPGTVATPAGTAPSRSNERTDMP